MSWCEWVLRVGSEPGLGMGMTRGLCASRRDTQGQSGVPHSPGWFGLRASCSVVGADSLNHLVGSAIAPSGVKQSFIRQLSKRTRDRICRRTDSEDEARVLFLVAPDASVTESPAGPQCRGRLQQAWGPARFVWLHLSASIFWKKRK